MRTNDLVYKNHQVSMDADTNLLIDADLAILGTEPDQYRIYTQQVRQEHSMFPDILFRVEEGKYSGTF